MKNTNPLFDIKITPEEVIKRYPTKEKMMDGLYTIYKNDKATLNVKLGCKHYIKKLSNLDQDGYLNFVQKMCDKSNFHLSPLANYILLALFSFGGALGGIALFDNYFVPDDASYMGRRNIRKIGGMIGATGGYYLGKKIMDLQD